MNLVKISLFLIVGFILFFVYIEYEKTSNELGLGKTSNHKNMHAIYRNGNQIEEKYSHAPIMKTLKLTGKIEEAMSYKITTYYKSDKKNSLCGERSFGLGFGDHKGWHLTYSYNKRTYLPTIKDGIHNIEIPLDEFKPIIGCKYHIYLIDIEIFNKKLSKRNFRYQGRFGLFAPSVYNKRNYTKSSTSVGSEVNIECTSKDYKYENNYFHSNCHLKSTSDTFFRQQDLKYSNYKLNITTLKQEDFELKRVLKSDEFNYKYKFIKKISQYPKIYNRDIRYFIDKIEQLYMYEKSLNSYLENIKNKLSALLKNKKDNFSIDEIKKIKDKIKVVSESIQANKEIIQIQKKLFLTNKYYKYQVLHFIDLSSKNRLHNFMNKLHKKERIAGKSFQKELLNCWGKRMRSRYFGLCIELKGITTQKSKQDIKVILNKISALRRILLMQYGINIRYSIID